MSFRSATSGLPMPGTWSPGQRIQWDPTRSAPSGRGTRSLEWPGMSTGERTHGSVWIRPVRTPRAARGQAFTQNDLANTAIALADRDGLDALSMRRVAGELGITAMSLYWYVDTKEQLVE